MTMTRLKISKTLLAVMLTSAVATGSAYAENNAQTTNESAGQKVDSSMNKVGNFMDDSAITAKVKAAWWIMTTSRAPISLSKPIKSRDPERFR